MNKRESGGEQFVNPYSVIPKYHQLQEILLDKIEEGEWAPNVPLPSERELEMTYNVSRPTVRKALDNLVSKGYLYREQGRGTFVAYPRLQQSLHTLTSFSDDMRNRGLQPGQQLLSLGPVEPSVRLRRLLNLPANVDQVLKIERLRLANRQPIGIHITHVPIPPGETITREELEAEGSLYNLLLAKFNYRVEEADETLESTVADEREADLLQIQVGSPLLLIERLSLSQERKPIELVKMLYRADRYKYYVHITR